MIVAIVQARMGSSRLPGKVLKDLGCCSVIEAVLKRTAMSVRLDHVCVAIPNTQQNEVLVNHVEELGFKTFLGSEKNVLNRYYETAKQLNAKIIVRITADCPLIDPGIIDDCIKIFVESKVNFLSNNLHPMFPDGLDVEVFDFKTLTTAHELATSDYDLEHVTPFMRRDANVRRYSYKNFENISNLRWTLDEPEDLVLIKNIFMNFFPRIDFDYQEVLEYVKCKPNLVDINSKFLRDEGAEMNDYEKKWRRAKRVIPGGNMLLSKRPTMFHKTLWPTYYSKAKGCYVWDLSNKKYIDFSLMGVGTNILGYGHSTVDEAVMKAIKNGNMSTLNSFQEVELAEQLIDLHPWSHMAKFARSGGEINAIAIRIARALNGKTKIAFCGYHGWHDWYLSANLKSGENLSGHLLPGLDPVGVPDGLKNTILPFEYNNINQLEKIIKENDDLGIIVMEVQRNIPPLPNFLSSVRELASRNNIILIFDECTSGFRETFGGLHLKYGVEPDMATFGKALGNGYAITALIGKRNVMEAAQDTFISSTFWTERIGFAAALQTLNVMRTNKSWVTICDTGEQIKHAWSNFSSNNKLDIKISGLKSMPAFSFTSNDQLRKTFITEQMLKRGFLASNAVYTSIAHTGSLVDEYLNNINEVFEELSFYLEKDQLLQQITGDLCDTTFKRLN
jgi:glutamate-1-semialdehyde 2,1-aminomutase